MYTLTKSNKIAHVLRRALSRDSCQHALCRFIFLFIFGLYFNGEMMNRRKKGRLCLIRVTDKKNVKTANQPSIGSHKQKGLFFFKTSTSQSYCVCPYSLSLFFFTRKREKKKTNENDFFFPSFLLLLLHDGTTMRLSVNSLLSLCMCVQYVVY